MEIETGIFLISKESNILIEIEDINLTTNDELRISRTMDQDWTTVTLRRRLSTKEAQSKGHAVTQQRDPEQQERARLSKLENTDEVSPPKKRVSPESIQALIRKRMELGLTQEKADHKCSFSRNTFKDLESHRSLPTTTQQSVLQRVFGVQLKINHI
jgi:ribosome-binding protein aMBF1 (putative translation factor)